MLPCVGVCAIHELFSWKMGMVTLFANSPGLLGTAIAAVVS